MCAFMADRTYSSQLRQTQNEQKSRPISNMASRHMIDQIISCSCLQTETLQAHGFVER